MAQVFPSEAQIAGATAGGDLSGTYPDPTVVALQGHAIDTVAPTTGDALTWNGTKWEPNTTAAGVSSFAGRTGAVTPALSDYGVEISAGETKTANNTLDDGTGNVTITGTTLNLGPISGTAATAVNIGGQGTNTGSTGATIGSATDTGLTRIQTASLYVGNTSGTNNTYLTVGGLSANTGSTHLTVGSGNDPGYTEIHTANILLGNNSGTNSTYVSIGNSGTTGATSFIVGNATDTGTTDIYTANVDIGNTSGTNPTVVNIGGQGTNTGGAQVDIAGTIATKGLTPATLTPVSGTAFQLSTAADVYLYAPISASVAGTVKVEVSPDNVTYYTVDPGRAVGTVGNSPVPLLVHKAWWVRLTTVSGTLTYGTATYY